MITISNIYSLLEIGKRKNLEDFIYPLKNTATNQDKIFIVCDGVGGENKGEVASKIVSETLGNFLKKINNSITQQDIKDALDVVKINFKIYIELHPESSKMSTTLTLAVIKEDSILVAWCGDSKIYYIQNNEIIWKSKDHSLVQSLIDCNEITEEEAKMHPNRNIILRCISENTSNDDIDFMEFKNIQTNDYLLLASDGFFEQVSNEILINCLINENNNKNELFLDFCKENTTDNFSMYLINLSNTK